ncbi:Metalloendopeptidase [Aphelenchoides fujianensis]|nr:Metalloendopeptidase [Aphelenchoides fujianensis]
MSAEFKRRTSSNRGTSGLVTASPQPPTVMFTRVTKCKNLNAHCDMWERLGHCEHSAKYMRHYCRRSCGLCTRESGSEDRGKRPPVVPSSGSGSSGLSRGVCVDKNLFCGYWARIGECRSESKFMKIFCKRSCGLCYA